ncbi:MAG: COX15/CtaA family protein [Halanaeroarchaeum sp.]
MAAASSDDREWSTIRRSGAFLLEHARSFAAVTAGGTFLLVLLGAFTAAAGAGATCNYTYPGCAGQLSPIGLSIPQFIEWFHRLAAMLVGYVIVGNAIVQWRASPGTRTSRSGWFAALLLPLQVFVGGVTVTFASLFPGGYAPPVQLLHFATALAIFVTLVATLVWVDVREGRGATLDRLYLLGVAGVGITGLQAIFARDLVFTFWPWVQTVYHALGLLALAALVVAALWARELGTVDAGLAAAIGALSALAQTLLVIGVFIITESVEVATYLLVFVQLTAFAGVAVAASWATTE